MQDKIVMTLKRNQKIPAGIRNPITLWAAGNQKAADYATFGGLRLVQAPGLSPINSIADRKILSMGGVDNFGTVEVAGIEPASPWVIIQGSSQSTPAALVFYHNPTANQNA